MEAEFEKVLNSKVVGLVKIYNFDVWRFWSFNIKSKVISKLPNLKNVSPFEFKFKFQNPVIIWKSVQYKTCRAW
jgi:hypothetical protein